MENNSNLLSLLFVAVSLCGFYCAYLYGHKTKKFIWKEYVILLAAPVLSIIGMAYFLNPRIGTLFIAGSALGFFLEYAIGFAYHKTLNERLWTYNRMSIGGYTSVLSIPIWGVGAVIFWFLSKAVGL
ncbi:MAG: hypothetical protein A3D67_03180 [Candidatus Lloydbacteria bacterium RIFCSPHIGHO2_02_FULL_51_22]|uniref:Uncharacterized protein n=2 Tax=Candidatus Lloydiibacteriota TaxID=1817910 RepID=A0A1G2DC73_9BACT|nr:MAG: hypothetical protein A3D67_03180 [Candidatus Lloydbacteria bacterium RIFCSPHIGHO2_02_FULL_51_22]OGZ15980.1 MAG: hypothetical protein A3G11_01325 [Candidatus Lloydbacteria bacterium RIFCSPLOWO2_12_FULL_51_9]